MYKIYLGDILLPVSPGKIERKIKNQNKIITLINQGEVNIQMPPGLLAISMDVILPGREYPFAVYENGFKRPYYFLDKFEQLKTGQLTFSFLELDIQSDGTEIQLANIDMTLENYTIVENAENGSDLTVKLNLLQYEAYGTSLIPIKNYNKLLKKKTTRPKGETCPEPKKNTNYTVVKGDTLWGIAKKFYGDGSKWTSIYEVNKKTISNPNSLRIGQILIIPGEEVKLSSKKTESSTVVVNANTKKKDLNISVAADAGVHADWKKEYTDWSAGIIDEINKDAKKDANEEEKYAIKNALSLKDEKAETDVDKYLIKATISLIDNDF